jgi:hypothetical protein
MSMDQEDISEAWLDLAPTRVMPPVQEDPAPQASPNSELEHCCEYLEYESQFLELIYPGTQWQRWVYRWRDSGNVILQVVFFCPYCGKDLRADCVWQIPGRPQQNELLRRLAGKEPE